MDRELYSLVRAVKNGTIQDPDHVRDILREAREQIDRKMDRIGKHDELLEQATKAFVAGWRGDAATI